MNSTRINFRVVLVVLYLLAHAEISTGAYNKHPVSHQKLATCQEYHITANGCRDFFRTQHFITYKTDEYALYLKFYVMANNDANIVLSNAPGRNATATYTIIVGGFSNTHSWIRNPLEEMVGRQSNRRDILSPFWPTPIVVRLSYSGELEVGIPGVEDPLVTADASDLAVRSICLYAYQSESRWFYNCDED